MTTTQDIPQPAGAVRCTSGIRPRSPAIRTAPDTCPSRRIEIDRDGECVEVFIDGTQWITATSEGGVSVCISSDNPVTPAQARELAAMLIQAADDVDRWDKPMNT